MAITKFRVEFYDVSCIDLTAKDRNGLSDPYVSCNFDNFKKFKSPVIKKNLNPIWNGFSQTFVYETSYVEKLHKKSFVIKVYDKDKYTSDDLIGTTKVDLRTLATGPVAHDLPIWDSSNRGGHIRFKLRMEEIASTSLGFKQLSITNFDTFQGNEPSLYLKVSHDAAPASVTSRVVKGSDPVFSQIPELGLKVSLSELLQSHVHIKVLQKTRGKDIEIVRFTLEVSKYSDFKMQAIPIEMRVSKTAAKFHEVKGEMYWKNFPMMAQMTEGIHVEMGIVNGTLFNSSVALPMCKCVPIVEELVKNALELEAKKKSVSIITPAIVPQIEERSIPVQSTVYVQPISLSEEKSISLPKVEQAEAVELFVPIMPSVPEVSSAQENDDDYLAQEEFSDLPGGFEAKTLQDGSVIYIDHFTRETSWERPNILPNGYERKLDKNTGKPLYVDHFLKKTSWDPPAPLPEGFERRQNGKGKEFYVDHMLQKTQWEAPEPLPSGWERKFHEDQGKVFFVNHKTKTTQWDPPSITKTVNLPPILSKTQIPHF